MTPQDVMRALDHFMVQSGYNINISEVVSISMLGGNEQLAVWIDLSAYPAINANLLQHEAQTMLDNRFGKNTITVGITRHQPEKKQAQQKQAEQKPEKPKLREQKSLPGVKHIIVVASGKGGVGKSTIAVNLAVSLGKHAKVGLLDADIYGPSVAKMMQIEELPPIEAEKMIPPVRYGVKCLSMGMLLANDSPVIWRGPMISKALQQLFFSANWGELDYLIVDMPPGTGDIHLSIAQNFKVSGAVIVSTPQEIALLDALKCLRMYQKLDIAVLGLVENMSYLLNPSSREKQDIFGMGRVAKVAAENNVPFLGDIPLLAELASSSDLGVPLSSHDATLQPANAVFAAMAAALIDRLENISPLTVATGDIF